MSGADALSEADYELSMEPRSETDEAFLVYSLFCFIFIAIIIFLVFKLLESYALRRRRPPPSASADAGSIHVVIQRDAAAGNGLNAAAISALPTYTYAELAGDPATASVAASTCAICLAGYKDGQMARLLPACGHVFHRNCADEWLRAHPTCPICRATTVAEEPPAAAAAAAAPPPPFSVEIV